MNENTNSSSPLKFTDIYATEQSEIGKRRERQFYSRGKEEATTSPQDCVGLALSGGGIRSATFCLGFLQELHKLKLLRIFDYLSTVSGGGYVGGWWSAWLSREEEAVRSKGNPQLELKDVRNASSLVARITDGGDRVSKDLLEQMRLGDDGDDIYRLLAKHREGDRPDPIFLGKLVEQLNLYIENHHEPHPVSSALFADGSADSKTKSAVAALQGADKEEEEVRRDNLRRWANRLRLEKAYPYELQNIFPPNEMIEPARRSNELADEASDGSLCAWKDPIHHLRLFANYLTPRKGMLSADTWRAVSVITRNLTLTWLILLPVLVTVMLLGQAYLLLSPSTHGDFLNGKPSLASALSPLVVLVGWSVVAAIGWLICNRENTSATDWIVQTLCLLALLMLLGSGLYAVPSGWRQVLQVFHDYRTGLLIWAVLTIVIVLSIWYWGLNNKEIAGDNAENISRWRKDVRRNRFSRAQARLLVTTTVVSVVLLVSWLSAHGLQLQSSPSLKIPFAIVPLISIAGSIFTALRATPTAGGDRSALREPSLVSRMIFAVTPGLVLLVLAVFGGFAANRLLLRLAQPGHADAHYLLYVAAMLAIALCIALAVYEMNDVKWSSVLEPSLPGLLFIGFVMVNASWGVQALVFSLVPSGSFTRGDYRLTVLLLIVSAAMAIIITAIILGRVLPRNDWKGELFRRLDAAGRNLKGAQRKRTQAIARRLNNFFYPILGLLLFLNLTSIGFFLGYEIFVNTKGSSDGNSKGIVGALILTFVAIAGGVIAFRLCVRRKEVATRQNEFELRWFSDKAIGKRPEGLWLLSAFCLIVPVGFLCLAHYIWKPHVENHVKDNYIFFPITLAALLGFLILLRSLVVQKLRANEPVLGGSKKLFDWAFTKIPGANEHHRSRAFQLIAFIALGTTILVKPVAQNISPFSMAPALGPANLLLMSVALAVTLPIFGVSLFQIDPAPNLKASRIFRRWKWVYNRLFLWMLASISIVLALSAGFLLPTWLFHVSEVPLTEGLTPILLPGAAGCFLLVLLDMNWGERDNRRSLWLITLAYVGFATIFFMSLASANVSIHSWQVVLGLLSAVIVWVVALGWMVDPNAVSMHQFYRGRLVRAYLGASNVRRRKQGNKEITETVAGDDLLLSSLRNCDRGGPYHLINTTLNLVGGRDLATAQRSASSFTLSGLHCGSGRTDYRATKEYMSGQLSLGTAVAASGAAVSPNMGSKKPTAALAMLMTLLNVRLGYWAPTPNREAWNSSQPRLWPFYLLREFFSQTNDVSTYCYLTDGGHFDNTGLYSLIERGCRYIVLVDCGADPKPPCFQDLGEAIRRCRIDFGTEIELNLDCLIGPEPDPARCFVVGKIHFSKDHMIALEKCPADDANNDDDVEASTGTIVYVKPAVVGRVTADVRQYALENDGFPHQTTANQWFDEAQFESYRRLGQFCASSAFDVDSVKQLSRVIRLSTNDIKTVFLELENAAKN
jgi:hypothetical protein